MIEGGVHHIDMLRFLAGGNVESVCGYEWNPEWSSFENVPSSGMYILKMENGAHCLYEGNSYQDLSVLLGGSVNIGRVNRKP